MDNPNPFIDKEITEMMKLQDIVSELQRRLMREDDYDLLIEYNHCLYALVEKQQVIYTRMKLSDDPKMEHARKAIEAITLMTGRSPEEPLDLFFMEMKDEIRQLLDNLSGETVDDYPFDPMI